MPLTCPKCLTRGGYYGVLKVPGEKVTPSCPNCGAALISARK